MRKVYFDNPAEFYCPLTGVRLWCDGAFRASPAARFIYIEEPNRGFQYLDEAFAKAITGVPRPFLVNGSYSSFFRRLCRGMKGARYIDFVLHCSSEIVHIGIDTFDVRSPQKTATATQAAVPPQDAGAFDYQHVLAVWKSTDEAANWGPVDWIVGIRSRPELVMLGADEKNGGESYATMDIRDGRIVDLDELPLDKIERLGTIPLWPTTEEAASQG